MSTFGNRYPGPRPFEDTDLDRALFRGREVEAEAIFHLVLAENLVVIYAKSGTGKTSLINAGLLYPLRQDRFFPAVVRVDDDVRGPIESVLNGFEKAARDAGHSGVEYHPGDRSSLWSFFKTAELWKHDRPLIPVVVFDQFEELFTRQPEEQRKKFIAGFAELLRGPSSPSKHGNDPPVLKAVLSLREDYLGEMEEFTQTVPAILRNRIRLELLTQKAAKQAIEEPAGLSGVSVATVSFSYSPGTTDKILEVLGKSRTARGLAPAWVEPLQLQLICQHVEEVVRAKQDQKGRKEEAIVIDYERDLHGDDGVKAILVEFYKKKIQEMSTWYNRRRLHRFFEKGLISERGRRLSLEKDDIYDKFRLPEKALTALVNAHLVRSEQRLGGTFYELSHDTLVEPVLRSRAARLRPRKLLAGAAGILLILAVLSGFVVMNTSWYQVRTAVALGESIVAPTSTVNPASVSALESESLAQWSEALAWDGYPEKALADAIRIDDPSLRIFIVWRLESIGLSPAGRTELSKSLPALSEAAKTIAVDAPSALARIAFLYNRAGNETAARNTWNEALRIAAGSGEIFDRIHALTELVLFGFSYKPLKGTDVPPIVREWSEAAIDKAFTLMQDKQSIKTVAEDAGYFVPRLGLALAALDDIQNADPIQIAKKLGVTLTEADLSDSLASIGSELSFRGRPVEAAAFWSRAHDAARRVTDPELRVLSLKGLAQELNGRRQFSASGEVLKDAYPIALGLRAERSYLTDVFFLSISARAFDLAKEIFRGEKERLVLAGAEEIAGAGDAELIKLALEIADKEVANALKPGTGYASDSGNWLVARAPLLAASGRLTEADRQFDQALPAGTEQIEQKEWEDARTAANLQIAQTLCRLNGTDTETRERLRYAHELARRLPDLLKDEALACVARAHMRREDFAAGLPVAREIQRDDTKLKVLAALLLADAKRRRPELKDTIEAIE